LIKDIYMFSFILHFLIDNVMLLGGLIGGLVLAVICPPLFAFVKNTLPKVVSRFKMVASGISADLEKEAARAKIDPLAIQTRLTALESATANAVTSLHDRLSAVETTILGAIETPAPVVVATPIVSPVVQPEPSVIVPVTTVSETPSVQTEATTEAPHAGA
jgi:hypothetical protein